ncbi:hypothetical protein PO909_032539 [Leuciscus waleckii]
MRNLPPPFSTKNQRTAAFPKGLLQTYQHISAVGISAVHSNPFPEIKTLSFNVTMPNVSPEQPRSLNPPANLNNDLQWSEICTVNQPAFLDTITEPSHMGLSITPTHTKQKPQLFEDKGTLIAGLVTPAISSLSSVQIILS